GVLDVVVRDRGGKGCDLRRVAVPVAANSDAWLTIDVRVLVNEVVDDRTGNGDVPEGAAADRDARGVRQWRGKRAVVLDVVDAAAAAARARAGVRHRDVDGPGAHQVGSAGALDRVAGDRDRRARRAVGPGWASGGQIPSLEEDPSATREVGDRVVVQLGLRHVRYRRGGAVLADTDSGAVRRGRDSGTRERVVGDVHVADRARPVTDVDSVVEGVGQRVAGDRDRSGDVHRRSVEDGVEGNVGRINAESGSGVVDGPVLEREVRDARPGYPAPGRALDVHVCERRAHRAGERDAGAGRVLDRAAGAVAAHG